MSLRFKGSFGSIIGTRIKRGPPFYEFLSGWTREEFNGYFNDNMSYFDSISPISSISTTTLNYQYGGDFRSVRWSGYFKTSIAGTYGFTTTSDDASYIWIGDPAVSGWSAANAVVNNGGLHGVEGRSGSIVLEADTYYPALTFYGENAGGSYFTMAWKLNNGAWSSDGSVFYRKVVIS